MLGLKSLWVEKGSAVSNRDARRITRRTALALGGGGVLAGVTGIGCAGADSGAPSGGAATGGVPRDSKAVALVRCTSYDPALVHAALSQSLDLLGDLEGLVRGKTVTIKPNLTGAPVSGLFGRPAGEVYITHDATVRALTSLLFEHGAARVRIVESIATNDDLRTVLSQSGWDVSALSALGAVEYENTRNLGSSGDYVELAVPSGSIYSRFLVNRLYHDTDVLVSLARLKMHEIAGVTLSMKNLYGMTPLSLYGTERAQGEAALGYRLPMHEGALGLPGQLPGTEALAISSRVPRTVADEVAARPIDLAVIDGISALRGGEGPWNASAENPLSPTDPGVLIAGWNPVATDAVAASVMGFDPLGAAAAGPYPGDNHIALAHTRGLGEARLDQLDVRGLSIAEALYPYAV